MAALDTNAGHPGKSINVGAVMVAFTAPRFAIENFLVKLTKSPPISGDDVDMGITGGHAEC